MAGRTIDKGVSTLEVAGPIRLTARGDLVLCELDDLRRRLEDVLVLKRRSAILDVHLARYISARALGMIVAFASEAKRMGLQLELCGLNDWHVRFLERAGLGLLLPAQVRSGNASAKREVAEGLSGPARQLR